MAQIYHFRDAQGNGAAPLADIEQAVSEGVLTPLVNVSIDGENWMTLQTAKAPPPMPSAQPTTQTVYIPHVVKTKPQTSGCTWMALGAIILCFIAWAVAPKPGVSKESIQSKAYYNALASVRASMKDPESTTIHGFDHATSWWNLRKDGKYEVGGEIRGQNSFGAFRTDKWHCVLDPTGSKVIWEKVGDQKSGEYPLDEK